MQVTHTPGVATVHEIQLGSGQMTHIPLGERVKDALRQVPQTKLLSQVMQLGSLQVKHCPWKRLTLTTVPLVAVVLVEQLEHTSGAEQPLQRVKLQLI